MVVSFKTTKPSMFSALKRKLFYHKGLQRGKKSNNFKNTEQLPRAKYPLVVLVLFC